MTCARLLIVALLLCGTTAAEAQARRPTRAPRPAPVRLDRLDWTHAAGKVAKPSAYDQAMALAENRARRALEYRGNPSRFRSPDAAARFQALADQAIAAYETAIAADPRKAEPHFALGQLIIERYVPDGTPLIEGAMATQAQRALDHWSKFERLAPTDPRMHALLDQRAIILTKLGVEVPGSYQKAIADYTRMLEVFDLNSLNADDAARILGNGAEVFMMVGSLPKAIELYARSLEIHREYLAGFGLALALDRDGQAMKAREVMREFARDGYLRDFVMRLERGSVFYVPPGEVHYYFALIHEVLGNDALAIAEYQAFIDSGAHALFHRRAAANISDLKQRIRARGGTPTSPPRDEYGRPVKVDLTWWLEAREWAAQQ